jgi:DNA-binding response OmpR family regulator
MPPNPTRILFVDDGPSIRMMLPPVLQQQGFEVRVAGTVPEALAEINKRCTNWSATIWMPRASAA